MNQYDVISGEVYPRVHSRNRLLGWAMARPVLPGERFALPLNPMNLVETVR
jgi:hypothetical protein